MEKSAVVKEGFEWSLLFSTSGAVIVACATLLIIVLLVAIFRSKFGTLRIVLPGGGSLESSYDTQNKAGSLAAEVDKVKSIEQDRTLLKSVRDKEAEVSSIDGDEEKDVTDIVVRIANSNVREEIVLLFQQLKMRGKTDIFGSPIEYIELSQLIRIGDEDALNKMKTLERERVNETKPTLMLVNYFLSKDDFVNAERHLIVLENRDICKAYVLRSYLISKRDGDSAAATFIHDCMDRIDALKSCAGIYFQLYELNLRLKEKETALFYIEKALLIEPSEEDYLFKAAYLANELSDNYKSFIYYRKLLSGRPKYGIAMNNLATVYQELEMKALAVTTLKEAAKFDHPYPLGNLAIRFANEGFLQEGHEMLAKIPDEYRNKTRAAEAAEYINSIQKKENSHLEEVETKANLLFTTQRKIYCEISRFEIEVSDIVGDWREDKGSERLTVAADASGITIHLEKERSIKYYSRITKLTARMQIELLRMNQESGMQTGLYLLQASEKRTLYISKREIRMVEDDLGKGVRERLFLRTDS